MVKGLVPIRILFLLQVFEMTKFVKLAMIMETKKQKVVLQYQDKMDYSNESCT
jgi:hypothetical protein